jgi:hypothetical protein
MILAEYIHERSARNHRRDLRQDAEHARLAAQADQRGQRPRAHQSLRLAHPWPGPRHRAALDPSPRATSLTGTR